MVFPASADFRLDRALLRRRFNRAARVDVDEADFLAREIARRMDERLDYIRIAPRRVLDLGCGTGSDLERFGERYPAAARLGMDFAESMLARAHARFTPRHSDLRGLRRLFGQGGGKNGASIQLAAADAARLPLADASVSLVWSNLMLPAIDDPLPVFREIHRVLDVGGLVMFSTLGPDTLRELREALPSHAGERVHRFIDMHDLGDALLRAGFTDPVMDMEMVTLTYASLDELFTDLRSTGFNNAALARPHGLSGRNAWAAARARYERLRRDGRLPVSVEIIQGHAWKSGADCGAKPGTRPDGGSVVHFHPRGADGDRNGRAPETSLLVDQFINERAKRPPGNGRNPE
ncbi:MAG: methyltransferase domain-containing protein [Azoarcus sp.]|nr:methyltransferase domain-containing protein [Azoarcus sp.]